MTADVELLPCGECGMPCRPDEYHPFAACLMFKACHNSETVRANMEPLRAEVDELKRRLEREDLDHGRTIDQRDAAEDALGRMFQAVTGRPAEWSSAWGYLDAIEEVEEHVATLATERDQLAAALEAAREDAARYRWLRDREIPEWLDLWHQNPDRIDAAIDAAMQRTSGGDHD